MYIKKLQLYNFQVIESFDAEFDGNVNMKPEEIPAGDQNPIGDYPKN